MHSDTEVKVNDAQYLEFFYYMAASNGEARRSIGEWLKSKGLKSSREMTVDMFNRVVFSLKKIHSPFVAGDSLVSSETKTVDVPMPDIDAVIKSGGLLPLKGVSCFYGSSNIPLELQQIPQWCCWRFVAALKSDNSIRITKPPVLPNGLFAHVNKPKTLVPFDFALGAYNGGYDDGISFGGLSFVLSKGCGVWGIDVDNCINTDGGVFTFSNLALSMVDCFQTTYIEVSPSGNGLRIFGKGSLPLGVLSKLTIKDEHDFFQSDFPNQAIEWYDGSFAKALTVTGNMLPVASTAILRCLFGLEWLKLLMVLPKASETPSVDTKKKEERRHTYYSGEKEEYERLTDDDVISIASKARNAEKFRMFYECREGGDRSAGDFTFLRMVAFYALSPDFGGGTQQLDSIFRNSPRMRKKWDEKHYSGGVTYGQHLVDKIASTVTTTFKSRK